MPTKKNDHAPPKAEAPALEPSVIFADDYTAQQIAQQCDATLQLLVDVDAIWPGLVSLKEADRVGNVGKLIARLAPALRALFAALQPVAGEAAATTALKKKAAAIFDAALGDADQGQNPDVFEVDLMVRRLDRIEAQQKIVAKLAELQKKFADDIINTGELVVGPGLKATELAKSLATGNADFASLLAPVQNALGDLTKQARAALAASRAAAKQAAAEGKSKDAPSP